MSESVKTDVYYVNSVVKTIASVELQEEVDKELSEKTTGSLEDLLSDQGEEN